MFVRHVCVQVVVCMFMYSYLRKALMQKTVMGNVCNLCAAVLDVNPDDESFPVSLSLASVLP